MSRVRDLYIDGDYLRQHPDWHEQDAAWKAANITTILQRNNVQPRTLCEIGCGAGGIVRELAARLEKVEKLEGYEVAPQAVELSLRRPADPRISFHQGSPFDGDARWDLVLAIDVFEHVDDYLGFLAQMRALAPRAVFHIPLDVYAFGVFNGAALRSAREGNGHLHHFTSDTALDTLRYAGFRVNDYMFTKSFSRAPRTTVRNRIATAVRSTAFNLSPARTARILGGVSLMVLADTQG